jgi:hypothetical protein
VLFRTRIDLPLSLKVLFALTGGSPIASNVFHSMVTYPTEPIAQMAARGV